MSNELKIGRKCFMSWPFNIYETILGTRYEPEFNEHWASGCKVTQEDDGSEYGHTMYFTAHGEGKVIYEAIELVKMPKGFIDRVVFKKSKVDPDGKKYGKTSIEILTKTIFLKHINSHTPFSAEYEVEN